MNLVTNTLVKLGLLKEELDYHLLRAGMVIVCLFSDIRSRLTMSDHPVRASAHERRGSRRHSQGAADSQ